jgi:hypothetical protein
MLGGLRLAMPLTAIGAALAGSMAGIPFFGGFIANEQFYESIRRPTFPAIWNGALVSLAVAASMCLAPLGSSRASLHFVDASCRHLRPTMRRRLSVAKTFSRAPRKANVGRRRVKQVQLRVADQSEMEYTVEGSFAGLLQVDCTKDSSEGSHAASMLRTMRSDGRSLRCGGIRSPTPENLNACITHRSVDPSHLQPSELL